MAWVYILKSKRDGSTTNLVERMKHHERGGTPSTKRMGEMELVLKQEYKTLHDARSVERKLKSFKRHDFIDKIVGDGSIETPP